jgi:uncharacterized membrane protein YeiH
MLQPLLESFGVSVAALTGVLAARGRRVDLFGVVVLAIVTALGGGTVRDVLMADLPVFWVRNPVYLSNAAFVAVLGFFVARRWRLPMAALEIADAFALAFFTILGAKKALGLGFGNEVAVTMGVVTGVTGGMIRDVLVGQVPLVFRPEIRLYATAALAGAALHVVLTPLITNPTVLATLTTGAILSLRLAAIRWHLVLPVFEAKDAPPPPQSE